MTIYSQVSTVNSKRAFIRTYEALQVWKSWRVVQWVGTVPFE